jgi:hypothetical protein
MPCTLCACALSCSSCSISQSTSYFENSCQSQGERACVIGISVGVELDMLLGEAGVSSSRFGAVCFIIQCTSWRVTHTHFPNIGGTLPALPPAFFSPASRLVGTAISIQE